MHLFYEVQINQVSVTRKPCIDSLGGLNINKKKILRVINDLPEMDYDIINDMGILIS